MTYAYQFAQLATRLRGIIFDLDGTLIDSAPDIAAATNRTLAGHGISIDAAQARRFLGNGARLFMQRAFEAHGQNIKDENLEELTNAFTCYYRKQPCRASVVYPGASQALAELRACGIRLAICTNKPQEVADRVVAKLGLDRWIDITIGAGTYALKPDPEPLAACLDRLGLGPGTGTVYRRYGCGSPGWPRSRSQSFAHPIRLRPNARRPARRGRHA